VANSIQIEIELDESGAIKGFKNVEDKAKKSGKKAGDGLEKGLSTSLSNITKSVVKLGSLFATVLTGATAVKAIQAANEQADAIERLNKALQANNEFSNQASQDLQDYAAELQRVTEFGDELIINQLALAKSFGASNEQAKLLVEAATGLSKEFGISLESATRNAAKTLGGYAGELGEVIPELKDFTTEQLRSGAAIDLLNSRFADSAKNLPTFSFATSQLSNAFGDLLEEVGKLITESPEVRALITQVTGVFVKATSQVKDFAKSFSLIQDVLIPLSNFSRDIINFVITPLEFVGNAVDFAIKGIKTLVSAIVGSFGVAGAKVADFIQLFNPDSELAANLNTFADSSREVFRDFKKEAEESFNTIGETPISESLTQKNDELRAGLQETAAILDEQSELAKTKINGLGETVIMASEKANEGFLGFKIGFADTAKTAEQTAKQAAAIVRNSLGRAIASSVSKLVTNLQNGKAAFKDFGNFVLGVFGDLAIQLGQFFIIQGIAVEALKSLGGAAAVAAGAALVALGTLLKNLSGEGGGGAATAGAGGQPDNFAGGATATDGGVIATAEPEQQEQVVNQIVVQGDVFDSEETGLRIFDIISEQSEKNGNVIIGGAFA